MINSLVVTKHPWMPGGFPHYGDPVGPRTFDVPPTNSNYPGRGFGIVTELGGTMSFTTNQPSVWVLFNGEDMPAYVPISELIMVGYEFDLPEPEYAEGGMVGQLNNLIAALDAGNYNAPRR